MRQNIRNGHPDFIVSEDTWPAFLYPHATCDPEDVEKGLFKSAILLKVCHLLLSIPWAICSLSSVLQIPFYLTNLCSGYWYGERFRRAVLSPLEKEPQTEGAHSRARSQPHGYEECHPSLYCLRLCTGGCLLIYWLIVFISISQLRFSLSNASAWHEVDGCFSYINFYNNIVDFFELAPGPVAQKRTQELLTWWSR